MKAQIEPNPFSMNKTKPPRQPTLDDTPGQLLTSGAWHEMIRALPLTAAFCLFRAKVQGQICLHKAFQRAGEVKGRAAAQV